MVRISARYAGPNACPDCGSQRLRIKDKRMRAPRHECWGLRQCVLEVESSKYRCKDCGRSFWQRLPGILPRKRSTEPFRRQVFVNHYDGVNRSRGWPRGWRSAAPPSSAGFHDFLRREFAERRGAECPRVLGIDEHFFSKKDGYATTFCRSASARVFDVVLGRSEAVLEDYLARLPGKDRVRVVCMDLASVYRVLVRKHYPQGQDRGRSIPRHPAD